MLTLGHYVTEMCEHLDHACLANVSFGKALKKYRHIETQFW